MRSFLVLVRNHCGPAAPANSCRAQRPGRSEPARAASAMWQLAYSETPAAGSESQTAVRPAVSAPPPSHSESNSRGVLAASTRRPAVGRWTARTMIRGPDPTTGRSQDSSGLPGATTSRPTRSGPSPDGGPRPPEPTRARAVPTRGCAEGEVPRRPARACPGRAPAQFGVVVVRVLAATRRTRRRWCSWGRPHPGVVRFYAGRSDGQPRDQVRASSFFIFFLVRQSRKRVAEPHPCPTAAVSAAGPRPSQRPRAPQLICIGRRTFAAAHRPPPTSCSPAAGRRSGSRRLQTPADVPPCWAGWCCTR